MKTLLNNIKCRNYADNNEEKVAKVFEKAIDIYFNNEWTLIHNALIPLIDGTHLEIDLIVAKNNYPVAIIEVKSLLYERRFPRITERLHQAASILYAPLCMVCTPTQMIDCSVDTEFKKNNIKDLNPDSIKAILESGYQDNINNATDNAIKEKWEIILKDFNFATKEEVKEFIQQIDECDIINEPRTFYLNEEKEDLLFKKLLGEYKKDEMCRFTTIHSVFRTCNEKMQSMCCIICMNDKSETDYATQQLNLTVQNDSEEINSCYIMSCCDIESKNNFTMWRLYADDAKGVCIEYRKENLTNDFFLAPICYAQNENQDHPELTFIKKLQEENVNGKSLKLNRLFIWKHFFKPFEYRDEKEIRLLFNKKCISSEPNNYGENENPSFQRKWIYESGFGIISPIVTFPIDEKNHQFPLLINKITFGPKAREVDVNINQLAYLMKVKGIKHNNACNDFITASNIKHYR